MYMYILCKMLSQVRGLYKTTKNHTYCNAIITIISSLPGEDGGGGPGLVAVGDDAHAVGLQAGVVHLDLKGQTHVTVELYWVL